MRLRTEIDENGEEEIVIRARVCDESLMRLQAAVARAIGGRSELRLTLGNNEYFVPSTEILFFETMEERTAAHLPEKMLYTDYRLYELEKILPDSFVRVSKSCLVNSAAVLSIARNLTGASELRFRGCGKKTYVSRKYYKDLIERIEEMRLKK
ncbi:MAG: LytTR family transcriptional regulator [Eubacteriales bacterium]|nr:LytTR family transcriptional regulator [Eubacteriales bacterium]